MKKYHRYEWTKAKALSWKTAAGRRGSRLRAEFQVIISRQSAKNNTKKRPSGNFRRSAKTARYDFRTNFSLHLGHLMQILPRPRGTRTVCLQFGQR